MYLDVPPAAREWLRDSACPLFITEGIRKADCAVSRGLCCIDLLGVWNFRDGNGALPDWEMIALKGRKTYIVFDSDVMEKLSVYGALKRLKAFLELRKADVRIIYLPNGDGGAKLGLDDYFAIGHTVDDLLSHATSKLKQPDIEPKKTDLSIPRRFKLIENGKPQDLGVFYESGSEEEPYMFVSSPIRVMAQTRTDESIGWGKLLEWIDPDGVKHTWAAPMSMLNSDGKGWLEKLTDEGLRVGASRKAKERLNEYIISSMPSASATCVNNVGWHKEAFVYPDETINPPDGEHYILQSNVDFQNVFKTKGTLEEWQSQISHYCRNNPILTFGVSIAFAAKLLKLLDTESGGFNLRGNSSKGKTTTLQVAASVEADGSSRNGFVEGWKATANGLEGVCLQHNDSILPLDELSLCDPHVAAEAAYLIANGQGKGRMTRYVTVRKRATWRTLFLSSSEISLSDHLARIGRKTQAGQEVRFLDVPIGRRAHGIFDDLHEFKTGQELADHLKSASGKYYGVAARELLKKLTSDPDTSDIRNGFHLYLQTFLKKALTEKQNGKLVRLEVGSEVVRAATRFALAAFAGETATDYGVTKWEEGKATAASIELFKIWLKNRGTYGSAENEAAICQVRLFIEQHGASRFQKLGSWKEDQNSRNNEKQTDEGKEAWVLERIINRAGFVEPDKNGNIQEYFILPEVFRKEVCAGFDYRDVARYLKDRGYLKAKGERLQIEKRTPEGKPWFYCVKSEILQSKHISSDDTDDSDYSEENKEVRLSSLEKCE